jgi:citrate lyase subunit beta / citryl-CoA lyase
MMRHVRLLIKDYAHKQYTIKGAKVIFDNLNTKEGLLSHSFQKMPKIKNTRKYFNSSLMINAAEPKHLNKLDELPATIAVINLEDGVADSKKEEALHLAAVFLSNLKNSEALIAIRMNEIGSPFFEKELEVINTLKPDAVRIPKIKHTEELLKLESKIDKDIDIHLSIETKEAFSNIGSFKTSDRVTTVFLGIIDLLEDLGIGSHIIKHSSPTAKYIMSKFLVDAKTAGFLPLSFVFQDYKDMDGFRAWLEIEKEMGFEAKACISPAQMLAANDFFAPSQRQLEEALYIKEQFEKHEAMGIGGFKDERFGFIDMPIYKNAILVLKKFGKIL